jgi:hypothetical protein
MGTFGLIAKLLTVILLDIFTCDGEDMKGDVSMCYGLSVKTKLLNYCSYKLTFGYFR